MKTNVCVLSKDETCLGGVLDEVERAAVYNGLDEKQSLRLRLLAEELVKMLPELVDDFSGSFWMENKDQAYELHALMKTDSMDPNKKGELLSVSKSGKNAAASGILGMIRNAVEDWLLYADNSSSPLPVGFCDLTTIAYDYNIAWSMDLYMKQMDVKEKKEWDGLEKSIIASFSDDLIVGIKGKQIEIIVVRDFSKDKN